MKRGVVASPALLRPVDDGIYIERSLTKEEIAFYILYWDEVIIPGSNLIYFGLNQEDEYIASGAISRPLVLSEGAFSGDLVASTVMETTINVAKEMAKKDDEDWVFHQFGEKHVLPADVSAERDTLRIVLSGALPTPAADVPLVEILEFKEKNKQSRNALHNCLDEVYLEILRSPDMNFQARKSIADLKGELSGLLVANKKTAAWSKFNLAVEFSLPGDMIFKVATGVGLDLISGAPVPVGTVVGLVASMVQIKTCTSKLLRSSNQSKLGYLSAAKVDKIIKQS